MVFWVPSSRSAATGMAATFDWEWRPSGSKAHVQLFVYQPAVINGDGYMGHPFFSSPTTDGSGEL